MGSKSIFSNVLRVGRFSQQAPIEPVSVARSPGLRRNLRRRDALSTCDEFLEKALSAAKNTGTSTMIDTLTRMGMKR